jgi:hypothetical protein
VQGLTVSGRCAGSRSTQYGIDVAVLENDLLSASILTGKGADVWQVRYKPLGADLLLKTPEGLSVFEGRDLKRHRLTWYSELSAGGWQDVLPHRGLYLKEPGADPLRIEQPNSGAAATVPWQCRLTTGEQAVVLDCSLRVPDSPLCVEKRYRVTEGQAALVIEERVKNVTGSPFVFTWTQHPAFGADLLKGDVVLSVPPCKAFDPTCYSANKTAGLQACEQPFDAVVLKDGTTTSLATVDPRTNPTNSNRFYALRGLSEAWAVVFNRTRGFGARLEWDLSQFKFLRYWYRSDSRFFALGVEPSNDSFASIDDSIANGTYTMLDPGQELATSLALRVVLA